MTLNYDIICKY